MSNRYGNRPTYTNLQNRTNQTRTVSSAPRQQSQGQRASSPYARNPQSAPYSTRQSVPMQRPVQRTQVPEPKKKISIKDFLSSRNIRIKPRFFVFLAVALLLIIGCVTGMKLLIKSLFKSEVEITYGRIEDVTQVEALLIREEECVRAEGYGSISYLIDDLSYVEAGTPVVNVFASGYSEDKEKELAKVEEDIAARQNDQVLGTIVNVTLSDFDTRIKEITENLRAAIEDNSTNKNDYYEQLVDLQKNRQSYIETIAEAKADSLLNDYYSNKTQLTTQIETWITSFATQQSGLISFSFDGFEPYLSPATLDQLDVLSVSTLLSENNPTVPEEIRSRQNLYRLVQPNSLYCAFVVKASSWKIGLNESCAIYFEGFEDITYNATVHTLSGDKNDLLVVLEINEDISPLINARKCKAVIGGRVEGMMVPLSALKTEGGQQGVYRADTNAFVPVRVVGQDTRHALVMPVEEGALTGGTRIIK